TPRSWPSCATSSPRRPRTSSRSRTPTPTASRRARSTSPPPHAPDAPGRQGPRRSARHGPGAGVPGTGRVEPGAEVVADALRHDHLLPRVGLPGRRRELVAAEGGPRAVVDAEAAAVGRPRVRPGAHPLAAVERDPALHRAVRGVEELRRGGELALAL